MFAFVLALSLFSGSPALDIAPPPEPFPFPSQSGIGTAAGRPFTLTIYRVSEAGPGTSYVSFQVQGISSPAGFVVSNPWAPGSEPGPTVVFQAVSVATTPPTRRVVPLLARIDGTSDPAVARPAQPPRAFSEPPRQPRIDLLWSFMSELRGLS